MQIKAKQKQIIIQALMFNVINKKAVYNIAWSYMLKRVTKVFE